MDAEFDAYYQWLGIPPKDQPPNLYRLLGIDLFEKNPDVIEAAADQRMGYLRMHQISQYASFTEKLLNEISAARLVLLDPGRKSKYDIELRSELASHIATPPQIISEDITIAPPPQRESVSLDITASVMAKHSRSSIRISSMKWLISAGIGVIILLIMLLLLKHPDKTIPVVGSNLRSEGNVQSNINSDIDVSGSKNDSDPHPEENILNPIISSSSFSDSLPKNLSQGLIAFYPFNGNAMDESGNNYHGTVHNATLTTDRNGKSLSAYEFKSTNSKALISVPSSAPLFPYIGSITYTYSFWVKHAHNKGANYINKYQHLGDSFFCIGSHGEDDTPPWRLYVFGNSKDTHRFLFKANRLSWHHIVVSISGVSQRTRLWIDGAYFGYATITLNSAKNSVVPLIIGPLNHEDRMQNHILDDVRIYNRGLTSDEVTALYDYESEGYIATDIDGNHKAQVSIIQNGIAKKEILLSPPSPNNHAQNEYNDDEEPAVSNAQDNSPNISEEDVAPLPSVIQTKYPVPPEMNFQDTFHRIANVYDLNDADTAEKKLILARSLYEDGVGTINNTDERYALLKTAIDLAMDGGSIELALEITRTINHEYSVSKDPLAIERDLLIDYASIPHDLKTLQSLIKVVESYAHHAHINEKHEWALDVVTVVYKEVVRSRNSKLRKHVFDLRKRTQDEIKAWDQMQNAQKSLQLNPDDVEAHAIIADYYCDKDWELALPHFSKCSEESLQLAAKKELDGKPDVAGLIERADAWYRAAENVHSNKQIIIFLHARDLYKQVSDNTESVIEKTHINNQLQKICALVDDSIGNRQQDSDGIIDIDAQTDSDRKPTQDSDIQSAAKLPGKVIPEMIDKDMRLARRGGPYKILGKVKIEKEVTLAIEQGTIIYCAPGAGITAEGKIESYGDSEDFVMFHPAIPGGLWDGIFVPSGTKHLIKRLDIRGAKIGLEIKTRAVVQECVFAYNESGIRVHSTRKKGEQRISNCYIGYNLKWGILLELNTLVVDHCTISNNGEAGILMNYYGTPDITLCTISHNIAGVQSNLYRTIPEIHSCNIINNKVAMKVCTREDFECEENYWGTEDPRIIHSMISDGRDKPDTGVVRFDPIKTKPIAEAGCSLDLKKF